ncbi:LOW QUALITY PROTEIN: hypothetical protein PanWU01x14_163770 [Parasponia andersonii]|uniref:Transmembrane protein n=1 Tax=Parasponia andersonii TaxID=3476 RepID=A0A2P5CCT4_PARAD|nr:LOW QUALITY PROTEIN: hypothetical protein PanWU01x14_163770 [Parasponia andersonii]
MNQTMDSKISNTSGCPYRHPSLSLSIYLWMPLFIFCIHIDFYEGNIDGHFYTSSVYFFVLLASESERHSDETSQSKMPKRRQCMCTNMKLNLLEKENRKGLYLLAAMRWTSIDK